MKYPYLKLPLRRSPLVATGLLFLAASAPGSDRLHLNAEHDVHLRTVFIDGAPHSLRGRPMPPELAYMGRAVSGDYVLMNADTGAVVREVDVRSGSTLPGIRGIDAEVEAGNNSLVIAQIGGANDSTLEVLRDGVLLFRGRTLTVDRGGEGVRFDQLLGPDLVAGPRSMTLFVSGVQEGAVARTVLSVRLPDSSALAAPGDLEVEIVGPGGAPSAVLAPTGETWVAARSVTGGLATPYGVGLFRRSQAGAWLPVGSRLEALRAVGELDLQVGFGQIAVAALTVPDGFAGRILAETPAIPGAWFLSGDGNLLRASEADGLGQLQCGELDGVEVRLLPIGGGRGRALGSFSLRVSPPRGDAMTCDVNRASAVR